MKIALVGAEAAGKSTLGAGLSGALGLRVLPDPRDVALRGSGYNTFFEWCKATRGLSGVLQEQMEREHAVEHCIIDSGAIDLYAFLQRWAWNTMSPEIVERLWQGIVNISLTYTHVLVMSPQLVATYAPQRFRNALNMEQTNRLIDGILRDLPLRAPPQPLPSGSAGRVLKAALELLG